MKLIYNNKEVANNTKNYNELLNKPLLNSKELIGNISLNDINVYNKKEVDNLIASTRSVKAVTALPSPLVENTMYYVGPDADNNYHVYLVDSALTLIDLGMAREESMYKAGAGIEIDSSNNIMADLDYKSVSLDSEGKIYVPTLEGTKGSNIRPVYLENGQITPVKQAASGNYINFVPYIANNGVLDGGQFIDFHTPTSTQDYDYRLFYNEGETDLQVKKAPSIPGATVLTTAHLDGTTLQWNNTDKTAYVNNSTSLTGTTDADKIGMTKGAIQKYTETLIGGSTSGATVIANNSNLNTTPFTAVGHYLCGGNASVSTLTNCPTNSGFRMIVENVVGGDTAPLSSVGGWVSRTRIIENFHGTRWVQNIIKEGASDTTITYGAWRRVLDDGAVSLKHWHPTNNTTYISEATVDGYVDHATCVLSGWFRLSQDVPANTVLFTLPDGYTIADNTYGFAYGNTGGFKAIKGQYNRATVVTDSAISANSGETKVMNITFMLSKYPA